ncbi:MAG: DUF3793 family protein [Coriobacteriales bacterium]|jgi:hypothetical protein
MSGNASSESSGSTVGVVEGNTADGVACDASAISAAAGVAAIVAGATDANTALARELEERIVRYCSPTLRGLKPASLFTFCCRFGESDHATAPAATPASACNPAGRRQSAIRCTSRRASRRCPSPRRFPVITRKAFDGALATCARKLAPLGIRIRMLTTCANGPLIYVYRPVELARTFSQPEAAALLERDGYPADSLDAQLAELTARLERSLPSHGGPCEFPHEIGLFLGYPIADVVGFIENEGRDFLCLGCWKAYHDVPGAQRIWARYRACTAHCQEMIAQGRALEEIAVPSTFVEATAWLPVAV